VRAGTKVHVVRPTTSLVGTAASDSADAKGAGDKAKVPAVATIDKLFCIRNGTERHEVRKLVHVCVCLLCVYVCAGVFIFHSCFGLISVSSKTHKIDAAFFNRIPTILVFAIVSRSKLRKQATSS